MEDARLLDTFADDYARLHDVAARDLAAAVPTCPGWTVADLVRHVAQVYLHKAETIRFEQWPDSWPPPGLADEEPMALLERAHDELLAQFAAHDPSDPAVTWHPPEQTVRFWIRRMAQETVIHRVDAELALTAPVEPIPDDLAIDGIDELLQIFLFYDEEAWDEEFAPVLAKSPGHRVAVRVPGIEWVIETGSEAVAVTTAHGAAITRIDETGIDATITGPPAAVLRRLWNRGGDPVTESGDQAALTELRALLTAATQ
jgi:uncharacterized protein (TIGR03083 family)